MTDYVEKIMSIPLVKEASGDFNAGVVYAREKAAEVAATAEREIKVLRALVKGKRK